MLYMKKNTIKRPPKLSAAERKQWDSVIQQMKEVGIDPASRLELLAEYVRLSSRIERLSRREEDPELGNVQISRAINAAGAERRRLHAMLFAGASSPEPMPKPAATRERGAFTAWVDFFEGLDGREYTQEERDAREQELTRLHGEPSMRALIIPAPQGR